MRHRRTCVALAAVLSFTALSTGAAQANEVLPTVPIAKPCNSTTIDALGPVYYDLGTGEQGNVPDPIPTADSRWDTVYPAAGDAYSITPHPAWTTVTNANWINSRTTYASSGVAPTYNTTVTLPEGTSVSVSAGNVTTAYSTTFTLVPEVVNRALNVEFAADNGARFYLNGHLVGAYDPPASATSATQLAAFKTLHGFAYAGPWLQDGLNRFTAVVSDRGVATGLLVRGGVEGCAVRGRTPTTCVDYKPGGTTGAGSVVTYSPVPVDLGTGEQGYVPDALGSVDTKWRTGPLANGNAYSVAPYGSAWVTPTTSNWISVSPTRTATPGVYQYTITFNAPSNLSYGGLLFQYAADNDVTFTLNGTTVGSGVNTFGNWQTVSLPSAPFVPGTNTLVATVTEYGVVTGLVVEGGAYLCRGPKIVVDTIDEVLGPIG